MFRAQPVLDLRKNEHERALRALASAERDLRTARQLHEEASASLADASHNACEVMQSRVVVETLSWHRVWITQLQRVRATHATVVAEREGVVAKAATTCEVTRRRVEAMERLKEKLWRAWEQAAHLHEQKDIDAIATLRHTYASRESASRSES